MTGMLIRIYTTTSCASFATGMNLASWNMFYCHLKAPPSDNERIKMKVL